LKNAMRKTTAISAKMKSAMTKKSAAGFATASSSALRTARSATGQSSRNITASTGEPFLWPSNCYRSGEGGVEERSNA